MLKLEQLSLTIGRRVLLRDVSLQVNSGEFITILGENGCGKSTLMRSMAGLHPQYSGTIRFNQQCLTQWSAPQLARQRAWVNQHNQLQFAFLTEEVLLLARANQRESQQQSVALICQLAERFGLSQLFGRDIRSLSGGERQRVFIAKALLQLMPNANEAATAQGFENKLLLLDEPTSALDFRFQKATMELLQSYCQQGLGIVCVSHDINLVLPYASQVVLLADGQCLACGPVSEVITPANLLQCLGTQPRLIEQVSGIPFITH